MFILFPVIFVAKDAKDGNGLNLEKTNLFKF